MEHHSALSLFTEFLRSPDPQVRRNALTALVSLRSESSFSEVVRAALTDEDSRVRRRAEDEIVAAGPNAPEALTTVLWDQLKSGQLQVPAYALIGRLRGRGMTIRLPKMSVLRRLKFALAVRRRSTEERMPTLRKPAFFGGLVGAVFLLLGLNLTMNVNLGAPGTAGIAAAAVIYPLAFAFFTYRWWRPVQSQADRAAGAFVDICILSVCGALAGVITLCAFLIDQGAQGKASAIAVALTASGLSFAGIRAGMLFAHGCARGSLANRILQIVSGMAAGILILTAVAASLGPAQSESMAVVWVVSLPVLFGIVCTLSTVDGAGFAETPAVAMIGRVPGVLATLLLIAAVLIPCIFALIPKRFHTPEIVLPSSERAIPIGASPAFVNLTVKEPQLVKVSLAGDFKTGLARGAAPLRNLTSSIESASIASTEGESAIEDWLSPGRYHVAAVSSKTESSVLALPTVLPRLWNRILRRDIGTLIISSGLVGSLSAAISSATPAPSATNLSADARSTEADKLFEEGKALFRSSNYRAIVAYSKAIKLDPKDADKYERRAWAYAWLEDYPMAIADLTEAIARNPRLESAHQTRGYYYYLIHDYARALNDLNKALELDPEDSKAYRYRADVYDRRFKYQEAIQNYRKAIDLDSKGSNLAETYNGLATVYCTLKDYQQCLRNAAKAIELNSEYADAYENRGVSYAHLGEWRRALQDFDYALEINPETRGTYFERASVHRKLGHQQLALRDLNTGLSFAPVSATDHNLRAFFYNDFGKYTEALPESDRARELEPDFPQAFKNRGRSLTGLARYAEAVKELDKAIQMVPELSESYWFRGDAKAKLGDTAGANADWAKAKELGYKPE